MLCISLKKCAKIRKRLTAIRARWCSGWPDAELESTRLQIAEIFREELNTSGKWSPGMEEVMSIVIDKLEMPLDTQDAEPHPGP